MDCLQCGEEIHPIRLKILPTTKVCVKCSNVSTYKVKTTLKGEKEDTWNEIEIIKK